MRSYRCAAASLARPQPTLPSLCTAGSWCPTGPSAEGAAGKCQPQL